MKLNRLFLAGAIAIGLVACKNEVPDVEKQEGNTFSSLTVVGSKSGSALKAASTDPNATDAEIAVTGAILYGEKTENARFVLPMFRDQTLETGNDVLVYNTKPWRTTATPENEPRSLALVLNAPNEAPFNAFTPATLAKDAGVAFAAKVDDIKHLLIGAEAGKAYTVKSIVMSADENTRPVSIKKDISETQAANSTGDNTNNRFDFKVTRTVAKAVVTNNKGADAVTKVEETNDNVEITNFSVVNGRTSTFVTKLYPHEMPAVTDNATDYVRLGTIDEGKTLHGEGTSLYTPVPVGKEEALTKNNGIYFMENITGSKSPDTDQKWNNTTYAKVYATYIPAKVLDLKADSETELEEVDYGNKGTTFYKGYVTGKLYLTAKAAMADGNVKPDPTDANKKVGNYYTYVEGKSAYRVLLNLDPAAGANHDTFRNTIYALNIKKVTGIGLPYDPVDPKDPNLPQPEGPQNPPHPVDPETPVNETHTYMKVVASIQPWKLVDREINLN